MDRRQIGTCLALKALGITPSVETFADRLIMQKTVYLAQAAGVHLGYYYCWYLHGPYCPGLAADAFSVADALCQGMDESVGWVLDAKSQTRLAKLKDLFAREKQTLARKLELLASVHFLLDRRQVGGPSARTISAKLRALKKNFDPEEVQGALAELQKHGLLPLGSR